MLLIVETCIRTISWCYIGGSCDLQYEKEIGKKDHDTHVDNDLSHTAHQPIEDRQNISTYDETNELRPQRREESYTEAMANIDTYQTCRSPFESRAALIWRHVAW